MEDNKVQCSDEVLELVVEQFNPIVNKYSYILGYEGAKTDMIIWLVNAVKRYKQKSRAG